MTVNADDPFAASARRSAGRGPPALRGSMLPDARFGGPSFNNESALQSSAGVSQVIQSCGLAVANDWDVWIAPAAAAAFLNKFL